MRNKTKLPVVVSDTVDCRSSLVVDNYVNVGQNDNISVMYNAPTMFSIRECGLYINHNKGEKYCNNNTIKMMIDEDVENDTHIMDTCTKMPCTILPACPVYIAYCLLAGSKWSGTKGVATWLHCEGLRIV